VPDTQIENKEYKVIKVEEDTVWVEIRGLDNGEEAWRSQKKLPISNLQSRIKWPCEEVSACML
jgi:hypothetical protein